ncbi:TIGR04211 family SH3 domain-containing protein [Kaarinaea lacus]
MLSLDKTMRNRKFYLYFIELLLLSGLILVPVSGFGKTKSGGENGKTTQYVTDNLAITLRSGKTNEHRIIRSLDSGTKLRVLESDDTHARVKTEDGSIGWVLKRYLVDEPVARMVLPPVQEKLSKLEEAHAELKTQFKEITKERNELAKIAANYEKLETAHNKLIEEAAHLRKVAGESEQIFQENQTLSKNKSSLEAQRDMLMDELRELRNGNNKLWFLTGAGVIFIGILIGAILSRGRKPKNSGWASGTETLVLRQP